MATKKVLVLGATGGTGRHVVSQALQAGHDVTVLVRDPRRWRRTAERLYVVVGSIPESERALDAAVRGQDVVISTLGVGSSLRPGGLISNAVPAITAAMERFEVPRLIFTSAYGVGETAADVPFVPRLLIRLLLRDVYADKAAGEVHLRQSALDWTIVYPVTLTDGRRTGRYRAGEHLPLRGLPRLSRADLAEFLLAQMDDDTYVRRGVLVSS